MTDGDILLTRDKSTGRVHKRVVMGVRLATLEECNLDQSGAFAVIGKAGEVVVDGMDLCENCFPPASVTFAKSETVTA